MAAKKQNKRFDIKQGVLISYLVVCVLMVALTLGLAFMEVSPTAADATPTLSPTVPAVVLTLQAEDYEPYEHEQSGQRQGTRLGTHAQQTPTEPGSNAGS